MHIKDTILNFISFNEQRIKHTWPLIKQHFFTKKMLLIISISFLAVIILIPIFTYVIFAGTLQSKEQIMNSNNSGITLLDKDGVPFFSFYEAKQKHFVPLNDIPVYLQQGVVSTEDKGFYQHQGFSIRGIFRAFFVDVQKGQLSQGGSTLTQQLVKTSLLNRRKSFLRKYQEIVLAEEIERRYTKNEILEMYLNSVYFGEGAFGAEQAAQAYYGKSAKNLTLGESTMLVGLLPAPSALSPISGDLAAAQRHQKLVLQNMVDQSYISQTHMNQAIAQKLVFNTKNDNLNVTAPHFALMVKQQLIDKYGEEYVTRSGFKVKTTLDLDLQKYAENVVKTQVTRLKINKASNGAAIVLDPKNGQILALVGSYDWPDEKYGKFDITTAKRQPGSSFKPIIYADAIEKRKITAATILKDEFRDFGGGYKPKDFDGKTRGDVTVRRALDNSLNIPAVEVMQMLGVPEGVRAAQNFGISTLGDASKYGLSLVLGAAETKLIDMTNAYASFADAGTQHTPISILEVKDKFDNTVFTAKQESKKVISPEASFIISSILSDNATRAEEFGSALNLSRPAAVKTGTTENFRDALTIGYTPQVVVGVWVGNNDNTPMDNIAGSLGAAPIWRQIMEHYLAGKPVVNFTKPSGIVEINQCTIKKDPGGDVNKTQIIAAKEFFIKGTEPKDSCETLTPSPTLSPTPGPTNTPQPSMQPTNTPTPLPTSQPTPVPTSLPSPAMTIVPTVVPSINP